MRVSLGPVRKHAGLAPAYCEPLLERTGARVILGQAAAANGLADPIRPAADSLFGPRGAALAAPSGPLFVCDTGHHRLLIWNMAPAADRTPADIVVGQPDFMSEGRNGKAHINAATLNVPTGVAAVDGVLAVADAWNHRVLIWHRYPTRCNQPADVVLGQPDFTSALANRGASVAAADSLNWCYGVAIYNGALYVADTGNRRVLRWNSIPTTNAAPADLVLGETDFITRDENGGQAPDGRGMRWPHGIAVDPRGRLFIADAGNNRIMVWNAVPTQNGGACSFVLGQRDCLGVDHNQAAYYPTPTSLNMPYGIAILGSRLVAADTANSRAVGYDLKSVAMNSAADRVAGQRSFEDKGENGWGAVQRNTLCWPYGISVCGNTLVIADSGNNRVLLWEAAP